MSQRSHLQENRPRCVTQARQAEARVRRLTTRCGAPPASARNLQMTTIQGCMLYAAELTWKGRNGMEPSDDKPHGTREHCGF